MLCWCSQLRRCRDADYINWVHHAWPHTTPVQHTSESVMRFSTSTSLKHSEMLSIWQCKGFKGWGLKFEESQQFRECNWYCKFWVYMSLYQVCWAMNVWWISSLMGYECMANYESVVDADLCTVRIHILAVCQWSAWWCVAIGHGCAIE